MAMGKRKRDRQPAMWVTTTELPTAASHPFYRRLNQLLREHGFDDLVEAQCAGFYAEAMGRPGLPPGIYFRLLLIGYFEGIDSERGIAWRAADSLALRDVLGVGLGRLGIHRVAIRTLDKCRDCLVERTLAVIEAGERHGHGWVVGSFVSRVQQDVLGRGILADVFIQFRDEEVVREFSWIELNR